MPNSKSIRKRNKPFRVLFVCLGNICRSPAAEGIFNHFLAKEQLDHLIICQSAGTAGYHIGNPPDQRMRSAAEKRQIKLLSKARQISLQDLEHFDWIITMDDSNFLDVIQLDVTGKYRKKIMTFCSFCTVHKDKFVPDPYYGGLSGFDHVLDILEDGCLEIIKRIKNQLSKT